MQRSAWRTYGVVILSAVLSLAAAAEEEAAESHSSSEYATAFLAILILLCCAALFAGLTLSIMGLDTLSLEIIADSGSEPDRSYAARILPIRQRGNQLLCTLILGNVMVNTLIAQITDSIVHGWIATAVSTALITLGGEILPQASMSAHALYVGSKSAPIVRVVLVLFYPICKPLAMFLDWVIGTDPGQIYERNELKKLMFMHAAHGAESGLGAGDVDLMMGALELHEKTVVDVMTPLHELFMLDASEVLTEETLHLVWEHGHSRIPVYRAHKNNIVGVLYAKDLLMANPDDNTPIADLTRFYARKCHVVPSETKLISMLKFFQTGRSHIALVQEVQMAPRGDPYYEVKGIVTIEDVIEELVHGEIFDEFDSNVGNEQSTRPTPSVLGSKAVRRAHLTANQIKACSLFLRDSVPQFGMFSPEVVQQAVRTEAVSFAVRAPKNARGVELDCTSNVWLYRAGTASSVFTLVISGRVEIRTMHDDLALELPSWSVIGAEALESENFTPNFSCRVVSDCRILQISHADFVALTRGKDSQ